MTYDASIASTTGRSTGQAMPDLRGTDVVKAPRKLDAACGMSPKPNEQIGQDHTMQTIGQDRWLSTIANPNLARRTRNHTKTEYLARGTRNHMEIESQLTNSHKNTGQFPLHPEPHINSPTFGVLHKENLAGLPANYPIKTSEKTENTTNGGARRYSYPPPVHYTSPYSNEPRAPLELEYMPLHANTTHQPSHSKPRAASNFRGRTRTTNGDTRQRCLRPIDVTDRKIENQQIVDPKNEHSKRKTAPTEEPNIQ